MKSIVIIGLMAGAVAAGASARAANLVTNGGFESFSSQAPGGAPSQLSGGAGGGGPGYTDLTGWTNSGYTYLFGPGLADSTGSYSGEYSPGYLSLYGPQNGVSNGLPATSPDGGNFIGSDPAYQTGPITQTISGLTPGHTYKVGFDWGGAQQTSFNGATWEGWQVSLGGQTLTTTPASENAFHPGTTDNVSHGFTGWFHQTLFFTATSATEDLAFTALGGPDGVPPFALLDGVSMNAVPEPATWTMMIVGIGGIGGIARRRRAAGLSSASAIA